MKKISKYESPSSLVEGVLVALKAWLSTYSEEGAECPACGQLVKHYRRPLTVGMAYTLVLLERRAPNEWVHVLDFMQGLNLKPKVGTALGSGDYAKLRFWGLLEDYQSTRDDGSTRNGWWRITEDGKRFVRGELKVASHAVVFNDKLIELDSSKLVGIRDALGKKFNYDELMAGGPTP
jgi:hypothetical protein